MHVCNAVYHPALTPIMQLELSLRNLHSPSTRFLISASVLCVINRFRKQGRKKCVGVADSVETMIKARIHRSKRKRHRMKKYSSPKESIAVLEGEKRKVFLVGFI